MQGVQVQFLVRELRSHTPPGLKNQSINQEQCCSQFSKDFKNGPRLKKKKSQCHSQRREEENRAGLRAGKPHDCPCMALRPWWALPLRPVPALYSSAGYLAQTPPALRTACKTAPRRSLPLPGEETPRHN